MFTGVSLMCASAYVFVVFMHVCVAPVSECVSLSQVSPRSMVPVAPAVSMAFTPAEVSPLYLVHCWSRRLHPHPIMCHQTPIISLCPQSVTHHTQYRPRIDSGLRHETTIWHQNLGTDHTQVQLTSIPEIRFLDDTCGRKRILTPNVASDSHWQLEIKQTLQPLCHCAFINLKCHVSASVCVRSACFLYSKR